MATIKIDDQEYEVDDRVKQFVNKMTVELIQLRGIKNMIGMLHEASCSITETYDANRIETDD